MPFGRQAEIKKGLDILACSRQVEPIQIIIVGDPAKSGQEHQQRLKVHIVHFYNGKDYFLDSRLCGNDKGETKRAE